MFAKDLGKEEDYKYFLERSGYWTKLYDSKTSFFRPKSADGEFLPDFDPEEYTKYFSESNAWQYFWFVPQNIPELIEKVGGKELFEQKLDSMFSLYPEAEDKLPIFSTGMIGQYAHGNEPSHHVAYLYNYVNKGSKTQELVREILTTQYKNEPGGHCGNEDCGQMSSWYIFSSLGFYPVNPAQGVYMLGAPLFDSATISLPEGKKFTVKAVNISDKNKYVERVFLNGKELDRNFITHQEIINGGTLTFEMTSSPTDRIRKNPEPGKVYLE